MRKSLLVILGTVFGLTVWFGVASAADKFGYVDLSKVFSEYSKTKEYDKTLGDKEVVYEAEREKKINEVKQLQDKFNLLSDKEKESKKGELEAKVKSVQEYDRQKQTDLRKEQDDKMKELLKDIEETIKQYASKEGYTMVFNNRVLVYQAKELDISDKIVELINKKPAVPKK